MVLTNFECWANGSSAAGVSVDIERQFGGNVVGSVATARHVDLFNPRAVHQNLRLVSQAQSSAADVSHISSNGYYGFSYVNAPLELNNNNDDNNNNNNNNICNFNNLNTAPMRKKRIFVKDDDLFANIAGYPNPTADSTVAAIDRCDDHGQAAAKRCRYDDDFTEQYFIDFFNMQAADAAAAPTQIGTQSCLMDTEDCNQQHLQEEQVMQQQQHQITQQQVDVAMTATSLHTNYATNNVECNFNTTTAVNSCSNNHSIVNNNSMKIIQDVAYKNSENLKNLSEIGDRSSRTQFLLPADGKLESLFAATHGGSQYDCWLQCISD